MKLALSFYQRNDAVLTARELLRKYVSSNINGRLTGGMIVETEAYQGPEDRGSHSYNHRRTARTEIMFSPGGITYMYICYGIHDMLNVVTGEEGVPHAVLIRAVEPHTGIDIMQERRQLFDSDSRLCRGPGALSKALMLKKIHNGVSLSGDLIWIEDRGTNISDTEVVRSARIGMNFEGFYKTIPWRFYVKGNPNVSRPHV